MKTFDSLTGVPKGILEETSEIISLVFFLRIPIEAHEAIPNYKKKSEGTQDGSPGTW